MRRGLVIAFIAVSLVATACAQPTQEGQPPQPPDELAINEAPHTEMVALRYGIATGSEYVYDSTILMSMDTSFSGGPADQPMPESMQMDMEMSATTRFEVSDGPEPGTYAVALSYEAMEFDRFRTTMDGETLDLGSEEWLADGALSSDMANLPEVEYVVDERGRMVSVSVAGNDLDLGMLGGGSPATGGFGAGQPFLGPEFAEDGVAVGDSWTTEWDSPLFPGMDGFTVTAKNTLVGIEDAGGVEVWVVETTTTMDRIELTFEDLMQMMFEGLGEGLGDADMAAIGDADLGMLGMFEMTMRLEQKPSTSTVWFDPDRGITVRQEWAVDQVMEFVFAAEGESGSMAMSTQMSGTMELRP
jgi:hypothetical protein